MYKRLMWFKILGLNIVKEYMTKTKTSIINVEKPFTLAVF